MIFDSKFTFYCGKLRSQNDLVITNSVDLISSFTIIDKVVYSDHCPNSTTCTINPVCSLDFITQCLNSAFNNNHWDINRRRVALIGSAQLLN